MFKGPIPKLSKRALDRLRLAAAEAKKPYGPTVRKIDSEYVSKLTFELWFAEAGFDRGDLWCDDMYRIALDAYRKHEHPKSWTQFNKERFAPRRHAVAATAKKR